MFHPRVKLCNMTPVQSIWTYNFKANAFSKNWSHSGECQESGKQNFFSNLIYDLFCILESSSDSSSSGSDVEEIRKFKKRQKKLKKKEKKRKKKVKREKKDGEVDRGNGIYCTVKDPSDVPADPPNYFLARRMPSPDTLREREKERKEKKEKESKDRDESEAQRRKERNDDSGRRIKGEICR